MERARDSREQTSTGANGQPSCVDLAVGYQSRLLSFMAVCAVAGAAAGVTSTLLGLPKVIEYFVFGLALYAGCIIHDRLVARSARRVLLSATIRSGGESTDWRADIRDWARRAGRVSPFAIALQPRRAAITTAARFLVDLPDTPRLLRLTPSDRADTVLPSPLNTRIEPTLLRSADPRFWETFSMIQRPTTAHRLSAISLVYGRRRFARGFVIVSLGLAAIGFVTIAVQTARSLLVGTMPPVFTQIASVIAVSVLLIVAQRWRVSTWFAVHGGLLITESMWHWTSRDLNRFTPADSVLVYWPETRQLAVAREGGPCFARQVLPPEAEAAIASWLSPLPCPPVELFSDLR